MGSHKILVYKRLAPLGTTLLSVCGYSINFSSIIGKRDARKVFVLSEVEEVRESSRICDFCLLIDLTVRSQQPYYFMIEGACIPCVNLFVISSICASERRRRLSCCVVVVSVPLPVTGVRRRGSVGYVGKVDPFSVGIFVGRVPVLDRCLAAMQGMITCAHREAPALLTCGITQFGTIARVLSVPHYSEPSIFRYGWLLLPYSVTV